MLPILPEIHALGTLNPHTLIMELPDTTKLHLQSSLEGKVASRDVEIYAHEHRHWLDLIATVWGQDYLDLVFEANDAVLTADPGRQESIYPPALRLFDADRAILFPSYYKYVVEDAAVGSPDDRWSMSFSTGARILPDGTPNEGDPILFVRFDAKSGHVARQPVTVGSLFELRALAAEVGAFRRWLSQQPADERIVAVSLRNDDLLGMVYDPQFTTYSVAAHIIGRALGGSEILSAMTAGDKIADVVLNLTRGAFKNLTPTHAMRAPNRERERGFRARANRGHAFAAIAFSLQGTSADELNAEALEKALHQVRLPRLQKIYGDAQAALERKLRSKLRNPDLQRIRRKIAEIGKAIFNVPDFDAAGPMFVFHKMLPSPYVVTGDAEEFFIGLPLMTPEEVHFLYECDHKLRESTRHALRAGRGMEFGFSDFVY